MVNVESVPVRLPDCPVCENDSLAMNDAEQTDPTLVTVFCYCGSCGSDVDLRLGYTTEVIQTHTTATKEGA